MITQLNPETEKYIADKISSGLYASSRDVIEAGIHLLQEKEDIAVSTQEKAFSGSSTPADEEVEARIKVGERLLHEIGQRYRQKELAAVSSPERAAWSFDSVKSAYGSLADDPIELLPQGDYPVIDPIL